MLVRRKLTRSTRTTPERTSQLTTFRKNFDCGVEVMYLRLEPGYLTSMICLLIPDPLSQP